MANVPIVTEVTLSQLNTLITESGLNEGLQYKVIDVGINWLLLATSVNTLKAMTGRLIINNGFLLPTAIKTDVLIINTGIINTDLTQTTGTPLLIVSPAGYYVNSFEVNNESVEVIAGLFLVGFASLINDFVPGITKFLVVGNPPILNDSTITPVIIETEYDQSAYSFNMSFEFIRSVFN